MGGTTYGSRDACSLSCCDNGPEPELQGRRQTWLHHSIDLQTARTHDSWSLKLCVVCAHLHCDRDLKGPNIFLSGSGDVLVGDFGLATLREPGDEAKHDQSVVGTPHYLSPELVSGKHYSFETDIWWVGAMTGLAWSSHSALMFRSVESRLQGHQCLDFQSGEGFTLVSRTMTHSLNVCCSQAFAGQGVCREISNSCPDL